MKREGNSIFKWILAILMRFPEYPPERIKNPTLRRWFEDVMNGRTEYDY